MILIAPDKYRGTLTSLQAARIIAENIRGHKLILPMADGGEGTAACIASLEPGWEMLYAGCFVNRIIKAAALDSSAIVGYSAENVATVPLERSSAKLGVELERLYRQEKVRKIFLGIGGTSVCDGGRGMLEKMSRRIPWQSVLVGLSDVKAPLLPRLAGEISAISFCRQKGYSDNDITEVRKHLEAVIKRYGPPLSPYAGAGGGIGYAVADVLGAPCYPGAEWLIEKARIPWDEITCVVTGEGKYDRQTEQGKVVFSLAHEASKHGITTICLAGCVEGVKGPEMLKIVDTSRKF